MTIEGLRGAPASGIASIVQGSGGGVPPSMAGSVQVVDSPLLRQQVEAQRLGIKHLKNENNRLKAKEEKQGGTVLVGRRVSIPCNRGQEQVHHLVLSQQQLQRVHSLLMVKDDTLFTLNQDDCT